MASVARRAVAGGLEVPPGELRAARLPVGEEDVVVFSFPTGAATARENAFGSLTASEREVAKLALAGHANAEIAAFRGTTVRTVSKQLDAIYRKLGVHSRAELAALMG